VAEGIGHVIDPAGVARSALQAAVTDNGPIILSNPVALDDFCRARLVGLPGEAALISSAARFDVPGLLRQRAGHLGLDAAIASVAATLSGAQSLNETASVWVVTEFARALGFPVPAGTQPMIVAAEPPTAATLLLPSVGSGGAAGSPPASGPAGPAGPAQPPGPTAPVATPSSGPQPGGILYNRNALGVAAAIILVGAYLGIAGAAHLSPFANASSTSPPGPSSSNSGSDPPSSGAALNPSSSHPTPDPGQDPAALPGSRPGRGPGGTCADPGPVAVIRCADGSDLAAGAFPRSLFGIA